MAYEPFNLAGKAALITGGNSGIGLGFAEAIAQAGGDVCIWGTNEEKNAAALEVLRQYDVKSVAMRCDVSNEEEVGERFAETVAELGKVTACFANAGVSSDRRAPQGRLFDHDDGGMAPGAGCQSGRRVLHAPCGGGPYGRAGHCRLACGNVEPRRHHGPGSR